MNSVLRFEREELCSSKFNGAGPYYHLFTSEDFPLIFTKNEEYARAISILALCTLASRGIELYAFCLMSNHLHLLLSGDEKSLQDFCALLRKYLSRLFADVNPTLSKQLEEWEISTKEVTTLQQFRNTVTYIHRNPFVLYPDITPFTYPWSSGKAPFSPDTYARHNKSSEYSSIRLIRALTKSRQFDNVSKMKMLDGHISIFEFCNYKFVESIFPCAREYYFAHIKKVESLSDFTYQLSEQITRPDRELAEIANELSHKRYNQPLRQITNDQLITIIRFLRDHYSATNKQLHRILGVPMEVIDKMYPLSAPPKQK